MLLATSTAGGLFLLMIALSIYMLPTIIAFQRKVKNVGSIAVINALLGWTFIAWVVTLAWSLKTVEPTTKGMT